MSTPAPAAAPESPWLPLLRRLTGEVPGWGIWKNWESALAVGKGDVDSVAPRSAWPAVRAAHAEWALECGFGPVMTCGHVPDGLLLLAVDRGRGYMLELDLVERQTFRGTPLFSAEELLPLMEIDARGFRRLRPGAEALLLLVLKGMRRGGRPNAGWIAQSNVAAALASDPEGVRGAARVVGEAALELVAAVAGHGWSSRAALALEARHLARGLGSAPYLARRLRYRAHGTHCAVHEVIWAGRRLPDDVDEWLRRVSAEHETVEA